MANIPEFISVLRRIRDVIYPQIEVIYKNTATLESQAEQSKIAAAASAAASDSSAGIATTRANEIKNVSAQANTLSSGSSATVSYNSTDGKFTFGLPVGAKGDKGESYTINAKGTTAGRAAYDAQSVGFSYLDISLSIVYFKLSATTGDWSTGTSFGRGEKGADGADGTGVESIIFHSTTSDNGLASQPGGIDIYRITLSNSNTYDISVTNGNDININGYGDKTIPKNEDEIAIADSDSYFNLKKLSIKNLKASLNTGFKNYIINGNFDIWQRASSFTASGYTADRWLVDILNSGTTTTNKGVSSKGNFIYLNPSNGVHISQRIELNPRFVKLSPFTLSFTTDNDEEESMTISIRYRNNTGVISSQDFQRVIQAGNGGKTIQSFNFQDITTYNSSDYIEIRLGFNECTTPIRIFNVQLEKGSVATTFENRPIGLELSLCQRYYCVTNAYGRWLANAASHVLETPIYWPTTMRVIPTTTLSGVAPLNCTAVLSATDSVTSSRLSLTASAAGDAYLIGGTVTASAEL